jgi:hypothetical protein
MKVEYLPADQARNLGPRYILQPENRVEQRFLTILRDAMLGKPYRLRMVGSNQMDKDLLGLPARPVVSAAFCIETTDGKIPEEFIPQIVDKLDPAREVPRSELSHNVVIATGRNDVRIVKQTHEKGGPTTIIEENHPQ